MNYSSLEEKARKLAMAAKPGFIKLDGKLYTFEFCQTHWVYNVYEDGFLYTNFNTKKLASAKKMLKEFLAN